MSNFAPVDLRLYAASFALAWLMLAASSAKAEEPPAEVAAPSGTSLSVASWGGAYGQSQEIAYFEPFTKKTGVKINIETYDGTLATIKAKIGGSASPFDIVDLSAYALDMLCRDGLLETIDSTTLAAGPGGQSASEDFISGGVNSCGIASVAWSTVIDFRSPGVHQGATHQDRRPSRNSALSRQAGVAQRAPLHARACAARRRRRACQHL